MILLLLRFSLYCLMKHISIKNELTRNEGPKKDLSCCKLLTGIRTDKGSWWDISQKGVTLLFNCQWLSYQICKSAVIWHNFGWQQFVFTPIRTHIEWLSSFGLLVCVHLPLHTFRGFCVMSSRLVERRLSFMATYRRLLSSSGSREWRSPASKGSVSRRPFWMSSAVEKKKKSIWHKYNIRPSVGREGWNFSKCTSMCKTCA